MDLYDEFGNYIGPDLDGDSDDNSDDENYNRFTSKKRYDEDDDEEDENDRQLIAQENDEEEMELVDEDTENRIILHEDKKYYPDAEEVYPGVKTVTLDEDAQDLAEPIIKPIKPKNFSVLLKEAPKLKYDEDFLLAAMQTSANIRNVALIGQLHHGKTTFADILVQATQVDEWDPTRHVKWADTRKDEQERQLSVKSTTLSLLLEDLKDKYYLLNVMDTPGHINFADEAITILRAADGAVVVVDAVEGVMLNTERLIIQAVNAGLPICLAINKVDRLILELKLPPQDAYYKLIHTIENVNNIIRDAQSNSISHSNDDIQRVSPELGNVCFSSGQHGWCFTLASFAQMYCKRYPQARGMNPDDLSRRLWGDWYYSDETHSLTKKSKGKSGSNNRSFVHYVLEPLYKIYAHTVGESAEDLMVLFRQLGIKLKGRDFHNDPRPLLKRGLMKFFGLPKGFVTMVAQHVPSPDKAAANKVSRYYTGYQTSSVAEAIRSCSASSDAPLVAHVVKLYNNPEGTKFYALTRIYSGKISLHQRVKVLGEGYTQDDDEDMAVMEVAGISLSVGRFFVDVNSAIAGNLVLLAGIDAPIKKTATIIDLNMPEDDIFIFKPLQFDTSAVVKMAVEPFNPSELPKMVEALRKINKSYPLVTTKVEESGEHIILGTGELYMDCIMHDLRHLYSDIEIKVADPVVSFCETVVESSVISCFAETPNKKNRFTVLAEPLEEGLGKDIESHKISLDWDKKQIGEFFKSKYDWDLLTARSIWAFGALDDSPNILLNNTLPSEVDQNLLSSVKDSVVQGFKWACREGPLCDEPIRNVKFRILDANIASEAIARGGGQVIPTARRSIYSSFLLATPRIMEPVYLVEIQAPADCVQAVHPVLARRRGHVVDDSPKPGTPFYTMKAYLPVIDSFGFETDLRSYTLGQVFCQQVFHHWAVVPGDPLDKNVILHPLEPSPPLALSRDFMVKTRRRKGLAEDVSVNKYLDDAMIMRLAKYEADLGAIA